MMKIFGQSRIGINALAAAMQILIQTGAGLVIYGFMIWQLGAQQVGGWVAVMALGMLACISDMGLREALVRRVALSIAAGDEFAVSRIITTTVLSVAGFMAVSLSVALFPWPWTLAALGQSAGWLDDYGWPIAVIVWLQRVGDSMSAALEGLQRFVSVACNNAAAAICGLSVAIWLIPQIGILGAAAGMATQFGALLLINYVCLRLFVPGGLGGAGRSWSWQLLKGSLNYGLSVQGMAVSVLMTETVCKILLARVGATALLSYFDFSFKVGRGLRSLLVAGNRVLVPRIAAGGGTSGSHEQLYRISFLLLAAVAMPVFGLAAANADVIMTMLIGHSVAEAGSVFLLMMFAWLMFCLMDPALNVGMGIGRLKGPLLGHLLMPVLALAGGSLAASDFGPLGIVAATAFAIVIGSGVVVVLHHYWSGISVRVIYPGTALFSLLCAALAAWIGLRISAELTNSKPRYQIAALTTVAALAPVLLGSLGLFLRLRSLRRREKPVETKVVEHDFEERVADESKARF
jgi:O-antigen/teichoic acid export membrane protein